MKLYRYASGICLAVFAVALAACGGGGGGSAVTLTTPTSTTLTVTGTAATGLAIAGATVTGKCKVGTATATTLANGTFTLTVTDGQLPCVLQVINPADGTKLHTLVTGTGSAVVANITPLTEMATARVLGSEPNVFFAAFDLAAATQKVTTANITAAQTDIGFILTGTIDITGIANFITSPLVAATQGGPTSGDAQDKLLDALKLKITTAQLGTVTTALASNKTLDTIKQTVISLTAAPTTPPVANAGAAQSVVAGSAVTLDASASSAATGKSLTYAWTLTSKPAGSAAFLASPTTIQPTFVVDVAGAYVLSVIINDGTTSSSAAAVTITASVANAAPVANAGVAQNVVVGSNVTLDGSASSDANNEPLIYAWALASKPAGSTATLSSSTSVKPTFTADMAGSYVASLTVNDGKLSSGAATASITSASANVAPVANAGTAQNVVAGVTVMLDGSASTDANKDVLTYAWTLKERPAGSTSTLSSAISAKPTFVADTAGNYIATLAVNDGKVSSAPVTVSVAASLAKYVGNQNGTVTDTTTGLIWMRCAMGQTWDGTSCTGQYSIYTWDLANALTGSVTFAGQSDWRLPNIRELQFMVNRAAVPPMDPIAFPSGYLSYWSSTPMKLTSLNAWYINSTVGANFYSKNSREIGARLVRGGQSLKLLSIDRPTTDYIDNGDGTATHTPTGLMWLRCSEGTTWTGTACSGTANILMTWFSASQLTKSFAGYNDWRIPTEDELISLVDYTTEPAQNTVIFADPQLVFWSKIPGCGVVSFRYGNLAQSCSNVAAIRYVRAGSGQR